MLYAPDKYKEKIIKTIESSKNELHLRTCSSMIGQFSMQFVGHAEPKRIEHIELELKEELDKKAVKLGLLTM